MVSGIIRFFHDVPLCQYMFKSLARTHAEIATALTRTQPDEPDATRSVRRMLSEPVPTIAELCGDDLQDVCE
jgi:hypothetical protein